MTALYVHIPFCKKKCNYCDFVSYAGKEALIDEYVEALVGEMSAITPSSFLPLTKGENAERSEARGGFDTIYFGGGTPTLLEPRHLGKILATGYCSLATEISIEANPGTADKAKLKTLRSLGLNRLSIGVQSFNDRHLKTLGRIHDAETAKRFYADARSAGFENINLDLIFALPGQTLEEWQTDLQTAIDLGPDHLSVYNLQIEEGTLLWQSFHSPVLSSQFSVPSEDEELAMYEYTIDTLTAAGYGHYEISNFARPGCECQHNLVYWRNENYLGFGAGAHSHVNGQRWSNPNCIESYIGGAARSMERLMSTDPSRATDRRETLFLGLRLLDGLPFEKFAGFEKAVAELIGDGLLEKKNGHYRLTRQGLYLGNLVFAKFV